MNSAVAQANFEALRRHRPELADRIKTVSPDPARYRLISNASPHPSLEVMIDGSPSSFYSREPMRDIQRQFESMPVERIVTPVLFGLGLGYGLRHLYDRCRERFFDCVAVESDPALFRLALETTPLNDILADPRCVIFIESGWPQWRETVNRLMPAVASSPVHVIAHPPSRRYAPEFYRQAADILHQRIEMANAELDLNIRQGALIQRNLWGNLPLILRSAGIKQAEGLLSGQPALVIGAGPSLDKNVDQLRDVQDRCAVICVDTAFRTLLKHGIHPHAVVSNDPTELNMKHFQGIDPPEDCILAFDPELYSSIGKRWPGPSLLMNLEKNAFNRWLEAKAGPFGFAPKGVSVGNAAFFLARALGGGPMILIGFDLAYDPEGGRTHASAAALHREHGPIATGSGSAAMGPRFQAGPKDESIVWVDAAAGGQVPTSRIMAMYINQFAESIEQTQARVIDATEGGAKIPGAEIMTLRDALAQCLSSDSYAVAERFASLSCQARREAILDDLSLIPGELEKGKRAAEEGLRLCASLKARASEGAALRQSPEWQRLEAAFNAIHRNEAVKIALEHALFGALYQFIQKEPPNQVALRLDKYEAYFKGYLECMPPGREWIQQTEFSTQ